jgi:hypothetical protein
MYPLNFFSKTILSLSLILIVLLPQNSSANSPLHFGTKIRAGGRYDNVRMCVASPPGVNGGPAMDISAFISLGLKPGIRMEFDLPVGRPILFATAFSMLQFEPSATLKFSILTTKKIEIMAGPTVGLSLHYGPDVDSEASGDRRTSSFFAMGPISGGYMGVNFLRPEGKFDLQIGVTLYVTPLFSIGESQTHNGIVIGGSLDIGLKF